MKEKMQEWKELRIRGGEGCKGRKVLRVLAVGAAALGTLRLLCSAMVRRGKRLERKSKGSPDKQYFAFTNGSSLKFRDEEVRSIALTSIMGGFDLDLTGAKLADVTRIQVRCLIGGVQIKVSPMVEVRDDSHCVMGGVANMVPRYNQEGIPVIELDVECLMSGVSIKVVCGEEEKGQA